LNNLIRRIGGGSDQRIEEASSSSQEQSREHKKYKDGNYRYFDSDEDEVD
jgi:hypothetical protein